MPECRWLRDEKIPKAICLATLAAVVAFGAPTPVASQEAGPTASGTTVPEIVDTTDLDGPRQPVFFRHDVHAAQYELDCLYCHYTAEVSVEPGIPTMSTCMGCHAIIGSDIEEVLRVREYWVDQEAIEWVRIHALPSYVRFPHMRHVAAEVTCQECHGPVEEMPQVYQWANLRMGWCLDCHTEREVTTDCTACHY